MTGPNEATLPSGTEVTLPEDTKVVLSDDPDRPDAGEYSNTEDYSDDAEPNYDAEETNPKASDA